MSDVYTCPKCPTLFESIYLSGGFPGGKEREDIDCPKCGHTVDTDVTSAVVSTREITGERKAAYLAEQQQSAPARTDIRTPPPLLDGPLTLTLDTEALAALNGYRQAYHACSMHPGTGPKGVELDLALAETAAALAKALARLAR